MNSTANPEPFRRKKLEVFFIESDDRRTAFGRGYTGGTTPVNIHGKPIPDLSRTGGWIAALFIFGKNCICKISFDQLTSPCTSVVDIPVEGTQNISKWQFMLQKMRFGVKTGKLVIQISC